MAMTLIIGGSGSGKSTLVQAMLSVMNSNKRILFISNGEPDAPREVPYNVVKVQASNVIDLYTNISVNIASDVLFNDPSLDMKKKSWAFLQVIAGITQDDIDIKNWRPELGSFFSQYVSDAVIVNKMKRSYIDSYEMFKQLRTSERFPDVVVIDSLRPFMAGKGALTTGGLNKTAIESITTLEALFQGLACDVLATLNPGESSTVDSAAFELAKGAITNVLLLSR